MIVSFMRGKSLTARALSRYFVDEGVSTYTHVSDQHTTYGTKVISVPDREAVYVLDEILGNQTDLPITEQLRLQLVDLLPRPQLTELLIEVDRWASWSDQLTHAGGKTHRARGVEVAAQLGVQALCLSLVVNAIITWNTAYLELALDHLAARRGRIDRDLLARVSPALMEHVNPYGTYDSRSKPSTPALVSGRCVTLRPRARVAARRDHARRRSRPDARGVRPGRLPAAVLDPVPSVLAAAGVTAVIVSSGPSSGSSSLPCRRGRTR
jgi:hypothetical protein